MLNFLRKIMSSLNAKWKEYLYETSLRKKIWSRLDPAFYFFLISVESLFWKTFSF